MLVTIGSPQEIAAELARRVRTRRLDRGWTQAEMAARANVALDTLKKFERTGQISLVRLVRLTVALGTLREMEGLFREGAPASLDALEQPKRRRGRSAHTRRKAV